MTAGSRARRSLLALVLLASPARALDVPPRPDRYATDRAGVVDAARMSALNEKLAQFERDTSNQVLVYVDRRLPPDATLEEYAAAAFKDWAVGQKDKDNGVVFFVFVDDRKMRIEVGYGLEGALPDARAASIVEDHVKPRFRAGDYAGGVEAGADQILRAARGEAYQGSGRTYAEGEGLFSRGRPAPFVCWIPALVGLAMGALASRGRAGRERWTRFGVVGGLGAVVLSMLATIALQDAGTIAIGLGVLCLSMVFVVWHAPYTGESLSGRRKLGRRILILSGCSALLVFGIGLFDSVLQVRVPYTGAAFLLSLLGLPVGGFVFSRDPLRNLTLAVGRIAAVVFVPTSLFSAVSAALREWSMLLALLDWMVPSGVVWLAATVFARSRKWVIFPGSSGGGGSYSRSGYSSGGSSWNLGSSYSGSSGSSSYSGGGGSSGGGGASGSW